MLHSFHCRLRVAIKLCVLWGWDDESDTPMVYERPKVADGELVPSIGTQQDENSHITEVQPESS